MTGTKKTPVFGGKWVRPPPLTSTSTIGLGSSRQNELRCNSLIETHQGPESCLLSSRELQSLGGSGLKYTDSDDDVRLDECGIVAVEARKGRRV